MRHTFLLRLPIDVTKKSCLSKLLSRSLFLSFHELLTCLCICAHSKNVSLVHRWTSPWGDGQGRKVLPSLPALKTDTRGYREPLPPWTWMSCDHIVSSSASGNDGQIRGMEVQEFIFSCYSFSIRAVTRLSLPAYKGSTLRGGFGHAFRRACCTTAHKKCRECLIRDSCVYSWVFETPVPRDATLMRKYPSAPHPFILEPPTSNDRDYEPGDRLGFGLTLVGRAVDYLPYFIYSFYQLGRMGIGRKRGKLERFQTLYEIRDMAETWEYRF